MEKPSPKRTSKTEAVEGGHPQRDDADPGSSQVSGWGVEPCRRSDSEADIVISLLSRAEK